jgi:hypothetical protein
MQLIRETTADGSCKYGLVRLDKLRASLGLPPNAAVRDIMVAVPDQVRAALLTLHQAGLLEHGEKGSEEEHFVLKLKDRLARPALSTYATTAMSYSREYADHLWGMVSRAAFNPHAKMPD